MKLKLIILLGCSALLLNAQTIKVEGKFRDLSAQGFAVYKDKGYLLSESGLCRVINLKENRIVGDFYLASSSSNNHANCASFGVEKSVGSKQPVMYVSECRGPYRCFVEHLSDSNSVLLQTIQATREGKPEIVHDWVVDKKRKYLYGIRTTLTKVDSLGNCINTIIKYRLPHLSEGKVVVLTDKDKIDEFNVYFVNVLQGAIIKGKRLFLPVGDMKYGEKEKPRNRRLLLIVDLKKKKIIKKIDINNITNNEPEDCDFYKGKLFLYCGQSGGLYEIPTK